MSRPNNGIMLPPGLQPQQQQVAMQIASPMNDVQMVALVAASLQGGCPALGADELVNFAIDIVAEALVAINDNGELHKRVLKLRGATATANVVHPAGQ